MTTERMSRRGWMCHQSGSDGLDVATSGREMSAGSEQTEEEKLSTDSNWVKSKHGVKA